MNALTAVHVVVLAWLEYHPGDTPQDIARSLGAEADDIAALCDDLADAALIVLGTPN